MVALGEVLRDSRVEQEEEKSFKIRADAGMGVMMVLRG